MVGAWRLLGRGLGLGGVSDEAEEGERGIVGERIAWAEEGREVDPILDEVRATGCLTRGKKKLSQRDQPHISLAQPTLE